jgi:hypothetical protein
MVEKTSYKLRIFENDEHLTDEIVKYIISKSIHIQRELAIDKFLYDTEFNPNHLKKISPIYLENVYGSTYQSSYRSNDNIYAISHNIEALGFDDEGCYAILTPSPHGELIDFDKGILRPVWYKDEKDDYKLATFDIDFNISRNVA